ncbi:unnamed protein product [Protopolystoma xenopodis]|uniref:Uncharacterized protein n=1 Tax=Protopolystoma xenopodis TaxID=117903 RepID=A0A3S5B6A1_9PLAT|nr:unnamed protein product [Protopolystoma xenopodis]
MPSFLSRRSRGDLSIHHLSLSFGSGRFIFLLSTIHFHIPTCTPTERHTHVRTKEESQTDSRYPMEANCRMAQLDAGRGSDCCQAILSDRQATPMIMRSWCGSHAQPILNVRISLSLSLCVSSRSLPQYGRVETLICIQF